MSEVVQFVDEVCGIYFRSILLEHKGDIAIQHTHDHDHATYVGSGGVALIVDGELKGYYTAGSAVAVTAGQKHEFVALEDNTRLACIHDAKSADSIKEKEL